MAGAPIEEMGPDGQRHRWGTVVEVAPGKKAVLDFHINHPDYPQTAEKFTRLAVTFAPAPGDGGADVTLTQSNWEVLGEMAAGVRQGYAQGWSMIFDKAYKDACQG